MGKVRRFTGAGPGGKSDVNINARAYALRLIELRPRTVGEMRAKLNAKAVARTEIDAIIADLSELGLLDDHRFARDWIDSRRRLKPMGPARIRAELAKRGISRDIIDQALADYAKDFDLESQAQQLAERKSRGYKALGRDKIARRLSGFLARRGFPAPIVNNVLRKILKGYDDFE